MPSFLKRPLFYSSWYIEYYLQGISFQNDFTERDVGCKTRTNLNDMDSNDKTSHTQQMFDIEIFAYPFWALLDADWI